MSQLLRKRQRTRQKHPNAAEIPPALTDEEAKLSWAMQVQSMFKKAGMDKYLHEEIVEGGTIRPAVRDKGGLCEFPDCPNDYMFALKLDRFSNMSTNGYAGPVREGLDSGFGKGRFRVSASQAMVQAPVNIYVCEEHRDWRPETVPSARFSESHAWKPQTGVANIKTIVRETES